MSEEEKSYALKQMHERNVVLNACIDDLTNENLELKRKIGEANEAVEYWQIECDKKSKVLNKIKEKGVMYYDPEYSKIYGELCSMPGANNTRTPVIVIDDEILELLEEIE